MEGLRLKEGGLEGLRMREECAADARRDILSVGSPYYRNLGSVIPRCMQYRPAGCQEVVECVERGREVVVESMGNLN